MPAVTCTEIIHQMVKKSCLVRVFPLFPALPLRMRNFFCKSGAELPAFQDLKISEKVGSAAIPVGI
jgi:hypothetical protein